MKIKKLILIALCLTLFACSPAAVFDTPENSGEDVSETPPEEVSSVLSLPINMNDSLNPYTLKSQANKSATALLYDGLFRLTPKYEAEPQIASGAVMDGAQWRVSIKSGIQFSDGSAVTASDIVYSFQLAAASTSPYYAQLMQVQSCTAQNGEVVFTLSRTNRFFINNLTFPIIKAGTGSDDTPVGSGRFVVTGRDGVVIKLKPGKDISRCGPIKDVELIAMPDDPSIATSIKVGTVDIMQQNSRDELLSGVNSVPLDINALNFLAVGTQEGPLTSDKVRRAISLSINREDLVAFSYGSGAVPAYTPFNPLVGWIPDVEFVGRDALSRAGALLDEAGYTLDSDGVRRSEDNGALSLNLLVNSENSIRLSAAQRLGEQLARVGIQIKVVSKPFNEYSADYAQGRYDLCFAEMQLGDDLNLELVLPGIFDYYGDMSQSYVDFLASPEYIDEFLSTFLEQYPFIPLVYREGTLASSRNFNAEIVATKWDIFYNMAEW